MKVFANDDYDFSSECSTGQTLYYKILDEATHEVQLTYPNYYSYTTSGYVGPGYWGTYTVTSYWYNYEKPTGNIVIPEEVMYNENSYSVVSINSNTFYKCTDIALILIPSTINSIGSQSFYDCTGLNSLLCFAETPPTLGSNAFQYVSRSIPLCVPCGAIETYQNTTVWNTFTNMVDPCAPTSFPYAIAASANPTGGGMVMGAGDYGLGQTCTLQATANNGYTFVNWMEGGVVVSTDESYSFTVIENRTIVATFRGSPVGYVNGLFSIDESNKIRFSQGNLQCQENTEIWRFAENQWDTIGTCNFNNPEGWMDLFGWGTGENPFLSAPDNSEYSSFVEWGSNLISNGGNTGNLWRTLTKDEWEYILFTRNTTSGIRCAKATVNGICGLLLLPDDWNSSYYSLNNANGGDYSDNVISLSTWQTVLEAHGVVFLPAAGARDDGEVLYVNYAGCYWSSTPDDSETAYYLDFDDNFFDVNSTNRYYGMSVRLVTDAPTLFTVSVASSPLEGGSVSGSGDYEQGQTCTLTAIPNAGYTFVNWTEGDSIVSDSATYQFTVTEARDLVANFEVVTSPTPSGLLITLNPGWNWISYLLLEEVSLEEALENLTPSDGDMLKGQDGFSTFDESTQTWRGSISNFTPGRGYMYLNNSTEVKTFSYPAVGD